MSFILSFITRNPVVSALLVALTALSVFSFTQYTHIKILKARLDVAEQTLKARTATLTALEKEAELLKGKVKAGEDKISRTTKAYEKIIADLKNAPVPAECGEAVEWGATEFNKMMEGF